MSLLVKFEIRIQVMYGGKWKSLRPLLTALRFSLPLSYFLFCHPLFDTSIHASSALGYSLKSVTWKKSQTVPLCLTLLTIKNESAYSSKSKLRFKFTCIATLVFATRFSLPISQYSLPAARFTIPSYSFLTNGKWGKKSEKRVARCEK